MESNEKGDTAENVAKNWFGQSASGVSAHVCVDDNSFVQCVWDSNTAWHCMGGNSNGLGMELAGAAAQTMENWNDAYSQNELVIAAQVAAYWSVKFEIPVQMAEWQAGTSNVTKKGLCGHVHVPGHGSHYDPGVNFPWSDFLTLTQRYRKLYEAYLESIGH